MHKINHLRQSDFLFKKLWPLLSEKGKTKLDFMSETLCIIKYCILLSESKGNSLQNTEFVPFFTPKDIEVKGKSTVG